MVNVAKQEVVEITKQWGEAEKEFKALWNNPKSTIASLSASLDRRERLFKKMIEMTRAYISERHAQ